MSRPLSPPAPDDEALGRLVREAFEVRVDLDTAARHLWRLDRVGRTLRRTRARRTLASSLAAVVVLAATATAVIGGIDDRGELPVDVGVAREDAAGAGGPAGVDQPEGPLRDEAALAETAAPGGATAEGGQDAVEDAEPEPPASPDDTSAPVTGPSPAEPDGATLEELADAATHQAPAAPPSSGQVASAGKSAPSLEQLEALARP